MLKQGNRAITKVLVQWTNGYPEDATWEKLSHLQQLFPEFDPWGQGCSWREGICCIPIFQLVKFVISVTSAS